MSYTTTYEWKWCEQKWFAHSTKMVSLLTSKAKFPSEMECFRDAIKCTPTIPPGSIHVLRILETRASMCGPAIESMSSIDARINSFVNWPQFLRPTPLDLAKAGFFYEGEGDKVCCFYCQGAVHSWEPGDKPWIEHRRHYPRCPYVKMCTSADDFVKSTGFKMPPRASANVDGLTILKSCAEGFSIPPTYFYTIAETGKRFSSTNPDPRGAYQEHISDPPFTQVRFGSSFNFGGLPMRGFDTCDNAKSNAPPPPPPGGVVSDGGETNAEAAK